MNGGGHGWQMKHTAQVMLLISHGVSEQKKKLSAKYNCCNVGFEMVN